jgi:hypothetical protein
MHLFLIILLLGCLVALLTLVGYAFWRLRGHLARARQPAPGPAKPPEPTASSRPGGAA